METSLAKKTRFKIKFIMVTAIQEDSINIIAAKMITAGSQIKPILVMLEILNNKCIRNKMVNNHLPKALQQTQMNNNNIKDIKVIDKKKMRLINSRG